jgi:hypothetical protein
METAVETAEKERLIAEALVADPAIAADHVKMASACKSLDEAQEKIHTLYVRWQELETKRG